MRLLCAFLNRCSGPRLRLEAEVGRQSLRNQLPASMGLHSEGQFPNGCLLSHFIGGGLGEHNQPVNTLTPVSADWRILSTSVHVPRPSAMCPSHLWLEISFRFAIPAQLF